MTIESNEDGLLTGTFTPGPAYPAVESLFRAFEEAADAQALSAVDWFRAKIAALGLQLYTPDGRRAPWSMMYRFGRTGGCPAV